MKTANNNNDENATAAKNNNNLTISTGNNSSSSSGISSQSSSSTSNPISPSISSESNSPQQQLNTQLSANNNSNQNGSLLTSAELTNHIVRNASPLNGKKTTTKEYEFNYKNLYISISCAKEDMEAKRTHRVVFTGGPCAGKTTAINRLKSFFENIGWKVFCIPETATFLLSSGILFYELNDESKEREREQIFFFKYLLFYFIHSLSIYLFVCLFVGIHSFIQKLASISKRIF